MKTRAQHDSSKAYELISAAQKDSKFDDKAYGGLCHHFPTLVLRSGLCQAVAFYTVKASDGSNKEVYQVFLKHMAIVSGNGEMAHLDFQKKIQNLELGQYRHTTRKILAAAIWYKRFAVSLLGVDQTGDDQ